MHPIEFVNSLENAQRKILWLCLAIFWKPCVYPGTSHLSAISSNHHGPRLLFSAMRLKTTRCRQIIWSKFYLIKFKPTHYGKTFCVINFLYLYNLNLKSCLRTNMLNLELLTLYMYVTYREANSSAKPRERGGRLITVRERWRGQGSLFQFHEKHRR